MASRPGPLALRWSSTVRRHAPSDRPDAPGERARWGMSSRGEDTDDQEHLAVDAQAGDDARAVHDPLGRDARAARPCRAGTAALRPVAHPRATDTPGHPDHR